MMIPVSEAKGQLTELVRRAESGEEIVLTRHGRETVRLIPVIAKPSAEARRRLIEALQASSAARATPGPSAARSQDELYDAEGLPA